jgi:hypothetical protein
MQINSDGQPPVEGQMVKQGSCLKGRYILVRTLPLSEPGFLYAGRDQRTGEVLRIRSIPAANLSEAERGALREEARRIMEIRRSDYFPRVRDLVETEGVYFLVQEGLDGATLWDFQQEDAPALPDRFRIAHLFRQIADRLAYLHDHIRGPVLFRDLTPERVMISPDTRMVRLVDFGLPGMAEKAPEGTPGKGTRQWLAPELYSGEPHSIQTDIYSLGRVLQFMVFGETTDDPTPATAIPTAVGRGVPDAMRELVQRMIAPDPSLRPRSMMAAKEAFEATLDPSAASFAIGSGAVPKNHCTACGSDAEAENIWCPHCGAPGAVTGSQTDSEETLPPRVRVFGLEDERFLGLKPVSLERFSLLKMSAQVARLGDYENLAEPHEGCDAPEETSLFETLQVLRDLRGRALLVGEDPLGPVSIAERLLSEYRHREWVQRVLILAPGSLPYTWQHRLIARHDVPAEVFDPDGDQKLDALPEQVVMISSFVNLLGSKERKAVIKVSWDLIIVDAAHLCTSRGSHRWQLLDSLNSKYLLLLTATPIQDDTSELLALLRLVRPDLWSTSPQDFRASLDNTLPAIRDKIERTMLEVSSRKSVSAIQTTYSLAQPEGDAAELYNVILNSLASSALDPETTMLIKQALISASPDRLQSAATDETAAALIAGVRALLDEDLHPKIHHLLSKIAPEIEGKAVLFSNDADVRKRLTDGLSQAGIGAVTVDTHAPGHPVPAWQRFAASDELRMLLVGDDTPCPLPLEAVETAIFFDLPWQPIHIADRIARLQSGLKGENQDIKVLQLLAPGTVEEWLYDLYRDCLQVYTPGSPVLHAFQAAMHDNETFATMFEEVAAAGIKGCHGTSRALSIQERITGIRDHVAQARKTSEDLLRHFRREGSR